jgi:hypothetical protein
MVSPSSQNWLCQNHVTLVTIPEIQNPIHQGHVSSVSTQSLFAFATIQTLACSVIESVVANRVRRIDAIAAKTREKTEITR